MRDSHERADQEVEDPIKDNIVCRQNIRIRWRILEQPLSEGQILLIHEDNQKLMEVLVGGEETSDIDLQRDKEVFKEIRKLDAKMNLIMSWLGGIMWQQQEVPDIQCVSLSSKGMQFNSGIPNTVVNNVDGIGENGQKNTVVCENDELFMELFLEPRYPHPFITVAKVVHANKQDAGRELSVKFVYMSEQNQQWLDKYIFRLHRRQVALARKNQTTLKN